MRMRKSLLALAAAALLAAPMLMAPAAAQDRHERHDDRGERRDHREFDRGWDGGWRDHDIRRFRDNDFGFWREGHWFQGRHGRRVGWWWIVGGVWYFYPQPIYPYPDPFQPPIIAGPQPSGPLYYYCDAPRGYYPYVSTCASGWRPVPAG
jgi:hypothetical protein